MTSIAYAMGGAGGQGSPGGDFGFILMMTTIFLIFYFLLIRPAQKKQKETKDMIANLKHGTRWKRPAAFRARSQPSPRPW